MEWSVEGLRAEGFVGFVSFEDLPEAAPTGPGVYAVLRTADTPPHFHPTSPAGWFKGKDPSVPPAQLHDKWVEGSPVIYIGKATQTRPPRGLRKRLNEYRRHGAGEPVGHWGGRYVWQLTDSDQLLVAWRECVDATAQETALLQQFHDAYDSLPFANLRH